jgi:hypothetical protein
MVLASPARSIFKKDLKLSLTKNLWASLLRKSDYFNKKIDFPSLLNLSKYIFEFKNHQSVLALTATIFSFPTALITVK